MEIRGKVAVITAAGSGIGRATSLRLALDGASILVADVDEAGGSETVKLLEKEGGRALFVRTDVAQEADLRNMIDIAIAHFGGLDILHNNAGIGTPSPGFPEAPPTQWRRAVDINLTAVIMGTGIAAPIMQQRGGGVIINTSSMGGLYPLPQDPIYGATKAGIVHFTHSCAPWASQRNIRVNCVCPSIVDTPVVRRGLEAMKQAGVKSWAPPQMLEASDIADAIADLIGDDSLSGCAMEVRPSGRQIIDPRPLLVTVAEAAKRSGRAEQTICDWIASGALRREQGLWYVAEKPMIDWNAFFETFCKNAA
jgi:NAD(P)-dependent dehydrogenase (short-subunit alcohol dehydrogenase family)